MESANPQVASFLGKRSDQFQFGSLPRVKLGVLTLYFPQDTRGRACKRSFFSFNVHPRALAQEVLPLRTSCILTSTAPAQSCERRFDRPARPKVVTKQMLELRVASRAEELVEAIDFILAKHASMCLGRDGGVGGYHKRWSLAPACVHTPLGNE